MSIDVSGREHFPIAFLLAAVVLDLSAYRRGTEARARLASGFYVAGVLAAIPTMVAGVIAWFTAPHSETVHELMYWHPALSIAAVLVFAIVTFLRWRTRALPPRLSALAFGIVGACLLIGGTSLGGVLVHRGGRGVEVEHDAADEHQHVRDRDGVRPPSATEVIDAGSPDGAEH